MISRLKNGIKRRVSAWRRQRQFAASLEHLHRAPDFDVGPKDVLVIALVRNGAYYLDAFFDHYRSLGARHFAFLDNGSTDDSCARIKAEPGTVLDRSALPLGAYEDLMRGYPAMRYGKGRWCLYADMDEQLEFAGADAVGLPGLVEYLTEQGHTSVAAQMLEMFPKSQLSEMRHLSFEEALRAFDHYDISTVRWVDYHSEDINFSALMRDNRLSDPGLQFGFGGVRGKVFGENCCLTKHPLVFNGPDVRIAPHPHVSSGLVVSDVMALIRHYKFANDPMARDRAEREAGVLDHGENAARLAGMQGGDVSLWSKDAEKWRGISALYDADFIRKSARFDAWLEARK